MAITYSDWATYTDEVPSLSFENDAPVSLLAVQIWEAIPEDDEVEDVIDTIEPPVPPVEPDGSIDIVTGDLGATLIEETLGASFVAETLGASLVNVNDSMGSEMDADFTTGDSRTKYVQLTIDGDPFVISVLSIVTAQIVDKAKNRALTSEPVVCLSTHEGADWATSLVAIKFPRISTAAIRIPSGKKLSAFLEIQITTSEADDAEDITFYIPIEIEKGNLP